MALAARGTVDPVGEFLSRASYSEKLGRGRAMKRGRIPDFKIGDTPVSCRKDSRGDFVTMADAIEFLSRAIPALLQHRFPKCFSLTNAKPSGLN